MTDSIIKERISQYLNSKSISDYRFEKDLGLSKGYLNKAKNPSSDILMKMCGIYSDINPEWLLTGEGDMLKKDNSYYDPNSIEAIPMSHPKYTEKMQDQDIPLYDIEAAANLKTLLADKTQNILGRISIPNIPKCDGALYVRGDSMYPLLKSGDIVAFKEVQPTVQNIFWGEMYIVDIDMDGDEYLAVKYIQHSEKGDEWIKLVSYNQNHQPKDFHLSCVRSLALVKLNIRINTMK